MLRIDGPVRGQGSVAVVKVIGQLGLAAMLGLLAGVAIQCGGEKKNVLPDLCTSDADCVLKCGDINCCSQDCPCDSAHTKQQAARMNADSRDRCGDRKQECPAPRPDACDWNARYRAVCRAGACVAEPIEGGAVQEFRAPEVPAKINVEDPQCRSCGPTYRDACVAHVEWPCEGGTRCRMAPECDPICCNRIDSIEDNLEAAPWGPKIPTGKPRPTSGVLLMAATDEDGHRLVFVDMAGERRMATTSIPLAQIGPMATWVDGTLDFLFVHQEQLERVSFPSATRQRLSGDVDVLSGLDVAPAGDVVWLGLPAIRGLGGLAYLHLGPPNAVITRIPWSSYEDAYPRWSVDGKRVALTSAHLAGQVAVVDAGTGRLEGPRTSDPFIKPTWHPSGEFLLLWLQTREKGCEMIVATADRTRYARLGIAIQASRCPTIAVSPEGDHLAAFVDGQGLVLYRFGSPQPETLAIHGDPDVLEWLPVRLTALGLSPDPIAEPVVAPK